MGNFLSKKNTTGIEVDVVYPSKFTLIVDQVSNSNNGYQIFRYKVPNKYKHAADLINLKITFCKTYLIKSFEINKNLLKRVVINNKYYFDTEHESFETGTLFLRLNKNYELNYVIFELHYTDLKKLSI
jgi:hypothetical protein